MYRFTAQGDVRKGTGGKGTAEAPVAWTGASGTGHAESRAEQEAGKAKRGRGRRQGRLRQRGYDKKIPRIGASGEE